jgi:glycosyltransferase involved in cell wall biosynthesis
MKFAFISTMCGAPWGGSEELWSHAAERLLAAGHEVHIGVLEWPARQPSMITGLGQTGAVLHMWPPPRNLRSRLKRKFFAHSDFAWLDKIHPDLLVISQGSNFDGVPCMLHALSQRIAYVPIAHMAASGCWPPSDESEAGARAYVGARLCCFVSEGNRRLTERQIAARLDRVEIVRNPFNVSYDANPAWPASNEPLQLACVGRLCADAKGQDLLLDVLSRPRWRDRTLRVRFFGDGPSRGHLQRLSNMLELESVDFAGHVGDIEHVWSQHHALVLASRFEGLPIALVEAMLCRRAALVPTPTCSTTPWSDCGFTAMNCGRWDRRRANRSAAVFRAIRWDDSSRCCWEKRVRRMWPARRNRRINAPRKTPNPRYCRFSHAPDRFSHCRHLFPPGMPEEVPRGPFRADREAGPDDRR